MKSPGSNGKPGDKTRVLIVDDSALIRRLLSDILASDPDIEVVGTATEAFMARDKIKRLAPDVLTLDVEMPRMDGLTFLRNLMRLRPMPVVMVSTLTERGASVTLEAMELGAIDFVAKPKMDVGRTLPDYAAEIIGKVKAARHARVRQLQPASSGKMAVKKAHSADAIIPRSGQSLNFKTTDSIVAIGASTGGTEAIREVVSALPSDFPGVVIAQHIPPAFSTAFAKRLNDFSALAVTEATDGEQILSGRAYVAPGDAHLMVVRDGAQYRCKLSSGPPVNRHRPSVDVLFRSVAQCVGRNATGVILTGMGKDGARGLKEMRDAGACTIAQDERTSVVWGMPGEAVRIGGAELVAPLEQVAPKLKLLGRPQDAARTGT